jgi:broad specificity phosphatase PhoE
MSLRWRYAAIFAVALIAVAVVYWYFCWGTPTTVLLSRHGERQGTADALSAAGAARAEVLAHVLEKSGISAIYTSQANRTQLTAAPAASLLGIAPTVVNSSDVAGLVSAIRTNHGAQKVLVVGHSNTVPLIIAEFGGPVVTIGSDEFDNFHVLTVCRCRWQRVRLTNLQYGAASS